MAKTKEVVKTTKKAGCVIRKCGCKNNFQDKQYGIGNRVMNRAFKSDIVRCTSCGKEHKEV